MNDVRRQPGQRSFFQCDLLVATADLLIGSKGKGCLEHDGIDERNPHLRGGGHAGPVGVGQVETGEEEAGIGQAHAIDMVGEIGVRVDLEVLPEHIVDLPSQLGVDEVRQFTLIVQGVAAPKGRFLGQLGEG